jgi:hypothetical protein
MVSIKPQNEEDMLPEGSEYPVATAGSYGANANFWT